MTSFNVSKIIVLESLRSTDKRTGEDLSKDLETLVIHKNSKIVIKYHWINTKLEFIDKLKQIEIDAKSGARPILHIECHGSSDGIELADNNFIAWNDIKSYFIKINEATNLNLFIVLAACYGGNIAKTIQTMDRAPCFATLGPTDSICPYEISKTLSIFYDRLISLHDGDAALESIFSEPLENGEYYFQRAEDLFKDVFSRLIKKQFEPNEMAKILEKNFHTP